MISPYEFGFSVERGLATTETWLVSLPHQCGTWDIAGSYTTGVSHEEALALMDRFIAEAKEARRSLKAKKPRPE